MTRLALAGALVLMLVGCGGQPGAADTRAIYQYTCCATADIEQVYQPGQSFDLHWIARPAQGSTSAQARYVVLSAQVAGPYGEASALKKGGAAVRTLKAPELRADTWQAEAVVSAVALPADLPPGSTTF